MTAPTSTRGAETLAAATALVPRIAELANEIESGRALVPELVEAFRSCGFFHMLVPASLGGVEADPVTASRVVEEVSSGDGSAGWCVMIAQQNGGFAGFLPEARAREVWGNGQVAVRHGSAHGACGEAGRRLLGHRSLAVREREQPRRLVRR